MQKNSKMLVMLNKIEVARKHMIDLAYEYPINSKEVINASVKLDKLLNLLPKNEGKY